MKASNALGFTLIELMVTIMVMAITLTLAVPSFQQAINSNRVITQANDLLASLSSARSEAVKRGFQVTVCKANIAANPNQCDTTVNWESGWIVFVDQNVIGKIDGVAPNSDAILTVHGGLPVGYTLRSGGTFTNWVAYLPSSYSKGSGGLPSDTFRLCPPAPTLAEAKAQARSIVLNAAGRPRVSKGTTACP
jgi:type IV fimbrial biogenesis protein FimT